MAPASAPRTIVDEDRPARLGLRRALACAMLAAPTWVHAAPRIDCKAVNRGALTVELGSVLSDKRTVALQSGETLRFIFRAEPGPLGTVTLVEGAGSPRALLVGPSGTSVSFAATRDGSYGFQFATEGEEAASFTASCTAARSARRQQDRTRSPMLGGGAAAIADSGEASGALPSIGPAAVVVDPAALGPPGESTAPSGGMALTLPKQVGGPEMKLQWRSERHVGVGPDGPQIDASASGVEIGVKYKLESAVLIGAMAQFDPASEMLFGGQRSLLDQGWLAGPVTTVQFAPGLVLDARAAWGVAETSADDLAGAGAAAQRRLLSARLANPHTFGAWRFTPSINFSHFWEMQHTPGAAPVEAPATHAVGSGRIDIGPELAYRMELPRAAFIEPRAVLGGFWGLDSLAKPGPGSHPEPRLKAEAGVTLGIMDGPKLQALGVLEEGDGTTPDAWSGRLQLSVPLK